MKKNTLRGFTLVEMVIVIIIIGIMLSMTVIFGSDYLKELQLRKEKEELINGIRYVTAYVKSSNYFKGQKYEHMIVKLSTGGIDVSLDTVGGTGFASRTLTRSEISFLDAPNITEIGLSPYQRACESIDNPGVTGMNFKLSSSSNDLELCFNRDLSLCKLFTVQCPD